MCIAVVGHRSFGFWDVFLDSGKCFWILGSVVDSGKCFWILGSVLDSRTCFWILGSVVDSGTCFVPTSHCTLYQNKYSVNVNEFLKRWIQPFVRKLRDRFSCWFPAAILFVPHMVSLRWPTTAIHKYILYYCILYLSTQTYSLAVRVYLPVQ